MVATPRMPPPPTTPLDLLTHMSRVTRWTRVTLVALAAPAGLPLLVSLTGLAWPGLVWSWAGHGLAWARCRLARSSLLNTLLHLSQPYFMLCHFRCIFFALFCRLHRRLPSAFPFVCSPSHRFTAFVLCSFPLFPEQVWSRKSNAGAAHTLAHTLSHTLKLSERENVHMLCL